MALSKLILENFQSHTRSELDFHPNLNTVVGMSNVGKTAVTRALEFLLFGRWDSSWVRTGSKTCRITLATDTGLTVIREKGDKTNKYTLSTPGALDQVYEGFGTDVPEPVSQALRIHEVYVDANDTLNLNLSSQLEPLFLFSKPGSFRAKAIGKLSGAHYLDYAIRELNKDKRAAGSDRASKAKEAEDLAKEIESLQKVEEFEGEIKMLYVITAQTETLQARQDRLHGLLGRVSSWKGAYSVEAQKEALLEQIPAFDTYQFDETARYISGLQDLSTRMRDASAGIAKLRATLADLEKQAQIVTDEYVTILSENKTCPTCFGPLDEQTVCTIKENLHAKIPLSN